ncbi:MAG: HAMP domain-containing sensor histidine kinase [Verrucomicrobia bacterium]|nr:HAMP domain-containing sensor histidine kinase [Verrucomicrobiota bacterium]
MLTQSNGESSAHLPASDPTSPEQRLARLQEEIALRDHVERIARHDLKAPLSLILQAVDLLFEPSFACTDDQKKYLGTIRHAGRRMLGIIDLAHRVAAIEAGTFVLKPDHIDLMQILGEVTERLGVLIRSQRCDVQIRIDGAPPAADSAVSLSGDALLITALLLNLIKNALEATPHGEPIVIAISTRHAITITIANSGAMPAPMHARLFTQHATFGKPHGAGLGLYLSRRITETHGGTIHVDVSQPDTTTVRVTLPNAPSAT